MSMQDRTARILSPIAPSLRRYLNRGVISATLDNSETDRRDLERSAESLLRARSSDVHFRSRNRVAPLIRNRASEVDISRRARLSCFSLTSRDNASKRRESRRVIPTVTRKNCFVSGWDPSGRRGEWSSVS